MSDLVELIKKRPGMYIESQSATELDYFLRGFIAAKKLVNNETGDMESYYGFNHWVCKKFDIEANVSWRRAVVFHEPNEFYAFQKFFELWDEYTLER
ncbi:hypothetical protein H0A36_11135 [Endozoicomonas sp. SM1973]|uniref:Uncharacterized protein n=1 Tax=Spartinivicinus marinus TaxID=2994442 RepID=A0A853I4S1_9GAMM|nr:hypothetical protein [Spartinivicinus marinus]MCX4026079.1 hypothetical protein [Spartinivicinus marinus]NYZ66562.1 hypothetical protein [Spartinivicinus marinus]